MGHRGRPELDVLGGVAPPPAEEPRYDDGTQRAANERLAGARVANPIDAFVLTRLAREGLSQAPEAAPETLCRRLYLDLIGLPPTPAEVDAFVREYRAEDKETGRQGDKETLDVGPSMGGHDLRR